MIKPIATNTATEWQNIQAEKESFRIPAIIATARVGNSPSCKAQQIRLTKRKSMYIPISAANTV
jgi:hypothetical protein